MPGQGKRVLIIDDQEDMRFLLGTIFGEDGYQVSVAEDGTKGLELVRKESPALIVLDLRMPGLNGWEVIERLKQLPDPPPVLVVSGAHDEVSQGSFAPPVAGFLLKPFRVDEVLTMADRALEAERNKHEVEDRRREPRRPLVMAGKLLGADGQPIALGTILNLSRSGALFDLGLSLEPGRPIQIAVEVPGLGAPLQLQGEIRWSKEGALGVQFTPTAAQAQQLEALLGEEPPSAGAVPGRA